jgi:hypothetical protein
MLWGPLGLLWWVNGEGNVEVVSICKLSKKIGSVKFWRCGGGTLRYARHDSISINAPYLVLKKAERYGGYLATVRNKKMIDGK